MIFLVAPKGIQEFVFVLGIGRKERSYTWDTKVHNHRMTTVSISAIPTRYKGILFRSRLEARWAAFFDLAGWSWDYEPPEVIADGIAWLPDFRVSFSCPNSECDGKHVLLVEVKPFFQLSEFGQTKAHEIERNHLFGSDLPCDSVAFFGANPSTTQWQMTHGSGGGIYDVPYWVGDDVDKLWAEAGNLVMYKRP